MATPARQPDRAGEGRTSYGSDPSQFGELYLPSGTPRGVVVVIHGGFWRSQHDYTLGSPLAASLAEQGWAVWNLEYRRMGNGGGNPTTFDDVAAGIDKVADLGLDTSTVVTLGHSAGGHLATWAASRGRFASWQPERVKVSHVISQAGVLDLRQAYVDQLGGGAVENFLGHPPTDADDPLDAIRQAPLDIPVWCIHATADTNVPISQSQAYVDAVTKAGATAELHAVPGDHFVLIDPSSGAWADTLAHLDALT
ncbi:alpha/beta hydrolase [Nocardia sp. NPDC049190]|uniref:alpha/beta hydrolase family protein n=1 Tax=Nocardia sp. NPDC049190 TaxID=3155650 RepID=UPI0033D5D6F9